MIAFYDNQPTKLEAVGNGSYVYRFNIQKVEKPATVELIHKFLFPVVVPFLRDNCFSYLV